MGTGVLSASKDYFLRRKNTFPTPSVRPLPASTLYNPLDEVLGTRALVRVIRVLVTHDGSLAVSEIARRSRLTLPSVRTALRRLLDLEVVTAIGASRSMVCGLRSDHPLVPTLVRLFGAEQEQADAVLRAVREAAGKLDPPPLAVWLCDRVPRSNDLVSSDIDIALLTTVSEPSAQAEALRAAVARSCAARGQRVSVTAVALVDMRRAAIEKAPLWETFQRDAVVILGDGPACVLSRADAEAASQ